MKKLLSVTVLGAALSGCILSPEQSAVTNIDQPISISGLVRKKTLPIVIRCEPDDVADSPINETVMPSETPILDKENKPMYPFSTTINVPPLCKFRIPVGQEGYQYRLVHFDIAQQVIVNGVPALRHQQIVPTDHSLKKCAIDQWTATQSWTDIIAECGGLALAGSRGQLYVRSDIEK